MLLYFIPNNKEKAMKKYFTKYLPVEGEIKNGDKYVTEDGILRDTTYQTEDGRGGTIDRTHDKKVKLFLCSRDIQVGDKVIDSIDGKEYEVKSGFLPPEMVKVIGEISPEAKWVKEGDEFLGPEAGVKCEVFPIHDHDDETEEMIFTDKYGKKVDTPIYLIKGPCGHFH